MNVGKVWSDMTIMQELEEQMSGSSTALNSRGVNKRGPESYPLPSIRNNALPVNEEDKEVEQKKVLNKKIFNPLFS